MEYKYDEIGFYYAKGEKVLLFPEGELIHLGKSVCGIQVEPIIEVQAPFEKNQLEQKINKCLSLCWSKTVNDLPKEPSAIEKYLHLKGYEKVVQQFDFAGINYDKNFKDI